MPLVIAPIGKNLKIIRLLADDKLKKHLESIGICANNSIKILSQSGGNLICIVKDCRLALDRNIATKILVA